MGSFTKRPYDGQRAGSDTAKVNKEIRRGRIQRKSPQQHAISEKRRRLDDLEKRISQERDPNRREPLHLQYANLAAGLPNEIFDPAEIRAIERYGSLSDRNFVYSIKNGNFQGSRSDFLPLHHLVKLISKQDPRHHDRYIYLLGSTSTVASNEITVRNLRGLEYFLLSFAERLALGKHLNVEIDGNRIQVERHNENSYQDNDEIVTRMRRRLQVAGIFPSDHYTLKGIKDGDTKVQAKLHIMAEERHYKTDASSGTTLLSYVTLSAVK